jgi:ABC-2 type transport system ATP-binding protein
MKSILTINRLNKSFKSDFWKEPHHVLKDLTFDVEEGGLCGFLGPNGAGKTTTIKILLRFISSDRGEIIFSDKLGKNFNEVRKSIGYFPERPYFYPHLKGMEFANYIGSLQGMSPTDINEKTNYWAEKLSIKFALDRKINSYSKGMLQRLGFVVSIIHSPKFLILDEPLSGLDPIGRRDFKRIMVDLSQEGTTVFFSSHIVSDVEEICNNVVVLMEGKTFYQGNIDQLIDENHKGRYELLISKADSSKLNLAVLENRVAGSDLISVTIDASEKDQFLKEIVQKDVDLKSLKALRPTLEEIVYTSQESSQKL